MSSNTLKLETPDLAGVQCPVIEGRERIAEGYQQYCIDESRMPGSVPDRIYFPTNTQETAAALMAIASRGETVTIGGARTGIVGGAANAGARNVLSLERLVFQPDVRFRSQHEAWCVRVGAGMTLDALHEALKRKTYRSETEPPPGLFYPVDPTETSASLGGNVAANASGARTLYYGPTRAWVAALTAVLPSGEIARIERGTHFARDGRFRLARDGAAAEVRIPPARHPDTKHVAGYCLHADMDLIDLFIGGEGTLAVVTEIDFRLAPAPGERLYLCVFVPDDAHSVDLVRAIKDAEGLRPLAIEYMDPNSLALLRAFRDEQGAASGVPAIPEATEAALYVELDVGPDGDDAYDAVASVLTAHGVATESTWAGTTPRDLEAMKKFRHALPERVNGIIARRQADVPGLTKVGTDMAVPDGALRQMMATYRDSLGGAGLDYVIFGHIGDGHVHVNILPRNLDELKAAKKLYVRFAEAAVSLGGSVAAEHGIGKLKKDFLRIQYNEEEIRGMEGVREAFDPAGVLNPGVLF